MSLNWVMRQDRASPPFVLLEGEVAKQFPAPEVSVVLQPKGQQNPEKIYFKGHLYLTNQRLVVLCTRKDREGNSKDDIDNFSLLLRDTVSVHLQMPWFGSNKVEALFKISNSNGGLNYLYAWELTLAFNSGGAIEFHRELVVAKTRIDNHQEEEELPAYESL